MTRAEIIKSNIENINDKYNTSFEVDIFTCNYNYDIVTVSKKNDSPSFSIEDAITILHNSNLDDWKISLNYDNESSGHIYLDMIRRKNGLMILNGHSSEFDEGIMDGSSLRNSYLANKMKNEPVYINNMDEDGNFYTIRQMTYIEIYVNKIGSSNRVNFG